jgi:hypothetical protein
MFYDYFDVLISKIIFFLKHFDVFLSKKNIFKNNYYYNINL